MTFEELHRKLIEQKGRDPGAIPGSLLSFDPGNTTGYAFFNGISLHDSGQLQTDTIEEGVRGLTSLFDYYEPEMIVMEDYRIYGWKQKQHAWSELHTPRLIGTLETIAHQRFIPYVKQSAYVAKQFCTDKRLQEWNMWERNKRHARDAIRHGCYYLLFTHFSGPKGPSGAGRQVG